MKVLATGLEWFTERPGGLPRYFADYTANLAQAGDNVQALVGSASQGVIMPPYVRRLRTRNLGTFGIRHIWHTEIARELKYSRYDIYNPHFAYYAWGAMNVPEMEGLPVVTHFHGPWAYESRVGQQGLGVSLRFKLQRAIERRVYRSSDRFIVLSDAFRQILIDQYGVPAERIHIIPGAVDVNRFEPATDRAETRRVLGLPPDRTILVSVRRLVKRMGLENLIRAMEVLVPDFPTLLLVIVGTGTLEAELRGMIEERKLQHHVRMVGRVSDEDLPRYYQSADFSVVPTVELEGFGLITAESLACGTPVLGTPVGGTKEVLGQFDNRLLLPGSEVAELVEGIGRLLNHRASLPTAEECRTYVLQNHTWEVMIPKIRQVFKIAMADRTELHRVRAISSAVSREEERA